MASQTPPKKNDASGYTFYVSLVSQANVKLMQANPTLAAGDVKRAIDDAAPANLATLPVVDGDFTKRVKVVLSQAETNGDNITIIFSDAAGAEWCDLTLNLQTVPDRQSGDAYGAIKTQTTAQPAQGAPPVPATIEAMIAWLYKFLVNKATEDGSFTKVFNAAGAVVDHKSTVSEAAGTVTRGKFVSGP